MRRAVDKWFQAIRARTLDMSTDSTSDTCHEFLKWLVVRTHIDPKRMPHILEVARAEAISTAAGTLGVSQSALSRGITEEASAHRSS